MNALAPVPAAAIPDTLLRLPRWVGWRNVARHGDTTKVPYDPTTGSMAKSDDPSTWASVERSRAWASRHVNGEGGGIGIMLGELGGGIALGGVDFDTCRKPDGTLADWARDCMAELATYTEISPSRTGDKAFFLYDAAALPALRAAMGTHHGRTWKRGNGKHVPAIELHLGNRYFTVTGECVGISPGKLRQVPTNTLLHLIRVEGPSFAGTSSKSCQEASPAPLSRRMGCRTGLPQQRPRTRLLPGAGQVIGPAWRTVRAVGRQWR